MTAVESYLCDHCPVQVFQHCADRGRQGRLGSLPPNFALLTCRQARNSTSKTHSSVKELYLRL